MLISPKKDSPMALANRVPIRQARPERASLFLNSFLRTLPDWFMYGGDNSHIESYIAVNRLKQPTAEANMLMEFRNRHAR